MIELRRVLGRNVARIAALGVLLVTPASASGVRAHQASQATLSPALGMRIDGRLWRQHARAFIAAAGDVNGDHLRDVLIGTSESHRSGPGLPTPRYNLYVVFGRRGPRGRVVRLDRLGSGGLHITRTGAGFAGGAGAGDVNGDGLSDLVLGTRGTSSAAGQPLAYVVYGRRCGGTVDVGHLGAGGFVVRAAEQSGGSPVAAAGDLDRDGFADILVGERGYGGGIGKLPTGRVLVIFGARHTTGLDTRSLGNRGIRIVGPRPEVGADGRTYGTSFANALAGIGDASGDHRPDILIGAPSLAGRQGGAFVVTGARRGGPTIDLRQPTAKAYRISGTGGDAVGFSVAAAGDQNGDGLRDVLLGEYAGGDAIASSRGPSEAYVVYGRRGSGDVALSTLGTRGAILRDTTAGDRAGESVASVGDVTGDGRADLLVGAPLADPRGVAGAGSSFLVPGGHLAPVMSLRGAARRRYDGAARFDMAGSWVTGLGDFNGDRIPDLGVAASRTDVLSEQSGSVYVVYGRLS